MREVKRDDLSILFTILLAVVYLAGTTAALLPTLVATYIVVPNSSITALFIIYNT